MKSDWLTTSSYERMYEILSAVNTLSIHAKLLIAKVENPIDKGEINAARQKLITFLDALQKLIQNANEEQSGILVGINPRIGELALQFMAEQKRLPPRSRLFTYTFTELQELLQSERAEDLANVVECLESLRLMVEQYTQSDVAGIFGEE